MTLDTNPRINLRRSRISSFTLRSKGRHLLSAVLAIGCVALAVNEGAAQTTPEPKSSFAKATGKKLIEIGWDQFYAPDPATIRDNIREMEKRPFEGIAFRLPPEDSNVFILKDWQENKAEQEKQLEVLASIKWDKFTDNFLTMYSASDMDWFSDENWKIVLSKVQFNARAARAAGCVGLFFDPESYGNNPWDFSKQPHIAQHNFAAYSAKVYQRGQQFMQAMEKEMPGLKFLMLRQFSEMYSINREPGPAARFTRFQHYAQNGYLYGLLLPFMNGMLEAASPKVQMIDGNENAYDYTKSEEYYRASWLMHQGALVNIPEELRDKFRHTVRAGNAIYVDHVFATRERIFDGMTHEERLQWFESNVYHALQTSDEYVWMWNEGMDWYNNPPAPGSARLKEWKNIAPPAGAEDAIISAKAKLEKGQELGYSTNALFQKHTNHYPAPAAE
jgi:hypothetical protein